MAAWIQGIYIIAAISACLPGDRKYPQKPIKMFTDNKNPQNDLPEHSESGSSVEDNIRAQSAKIDVLLSKKQ